MGSIPKGRPAPFGAFRVVAADALWASWREPSAVQPSEDHSHDTGAELLRACGLPAQPAANVRESFDMAVRLIQRDRHRGQHDNEDWPQNGGAPFQEVVKHASAHDLRRSFGFRWAYRVDKFKLQELMRHSNIETTRRYNVGRNAQNTAASLWAARDRPAEETLPEATGSNTIDNSGAAERITPAQETTQAVDSQRLALSTP